MTFWLISALFVLLALVFVLPSLIGKSRTKNKADQKTQSVEITQEQLADLDAEFVRGSLNTADYQKTREELERGLLYSIESPEVDTSTKEKPAWISAAIVILFIPAASLLLYQSLGNPDAVNYQAPTSAAMGGDMETAIQQLQIKQQKDPNNTDGWLMLGRSYMTIENYSEAVASYQKARQLNPTDPEIALFLADSLAMAAGGRIGGEPEKLILEALKKRPDNPTGLWMAGMAARERGDNKQALIHWRRLLPQLDPSTQEFNNLTQLIAGVDGSAPQTAMPNNLPDNITEMITKLENRLEADPDNAVGWMMLGRSYMMLNRFEDSVTALEKATLQAPDNSEITLSLADAIAMKQNKSMTGRPEKLVLQVLKTEPENTKALWLAGMAVRNNQPKQAIAYWEKLLPLLKDDVESREEVKTLIKMAGGSVTETTTESTTNAAQALPGTVVLNVTLDKSLAEKVSPNDIVFIYAKATEGPPMPLAAVRKKVSDLPLEITLDDTMAMLPQMKISAFKQLTVGARISKKGNAIAAPGDLYGEQSPVSHGDHIELTINQIVQ